MGPRLRPWRLSDYRRTTWLFFFLPMEKIKALSSLTLLHTVSGESAVMSRVGGTSIVMQRLITIVALSHNYTVITQESSVIKFTGADSIASNGPPVDSHRRGHSWWLRNRRNSPTVWIHHCLHIGQGYAMRRVRRNPVCLIKKMLWAGTTHMR